MNNSYYSSALTLPEYDKSGNGSRIKLKLIDILNSTFHIKTSGVVAAALERTDRRMVGFMSSLKDRTNISNLRNAIIFST